jgi:hypothetical protein
MTQTTKLALLLLTLCAGIGSFFFFQGGSKKETPPPEVLMEAPNTANLQEALIEQVKTQPETVEQVAEPVAEASAPVIAETQIPSEIFPRQAAPDLNPAHLSPELSRTYNNYSALRTETYRNPDSEFNRSVVADLEAARIERTKKK